jgi:hypothetical protein
VEAAERKSHDEHHYVFLKKLVQVSDSFYT